MFFPDFLFQLSGRDQQVTWLDPVFAEGSDSQLAITVTALGYTVPSDRALLLQAVTGRLQGGGAQTVVEGSLLITSPGGGADTIIAGYPSDRAANVTFGYINWSGSLLIPPDWTVNCFGSFSALAVANSCLCSIAGLLIPLGNIQRV